ncbi:hypothetical protein MMC20_000327 [Loxospora ochrophaea]|nr:hypothetical protein [Loxospora ochrophaea]
MNTHHDPVVLPSLSLARFVNYVLQHHAPPTTLIICSTREEFLQNLQASIDQGRDDHPRRHADSMSLDALLVPTMHLIATSRTVRLAFTPMLLNLRAFLAAYVPPNYLEKPNVTFDKPGSRTPLLTLLNPLNLHCTTSEFSAQGLSRTFAQAVDAAAYAQMKLVICESYAADIEEGQVLREGEMAFGPWNQQLPLLSESVRLGGEGRAWTGRTIQARQVVERWCKFIDLDEEDV